MTLASVGRRLLRILGIVAGVGLIVVICAVTALWLEHRASITLPTPSGPFAVGRVVSDWRDATTVDSLSPIAGTKRELLAWIWYPAATASSAEAEPYNPTELTPKQALPSVPPPLRVWAWFTRDWSNVHGHSVGGAPLSPKQASYPVVLFRAGASAPVINYSTLAEDLASHGYVVVGFDAPYRTGRIVFPDGRVIGRTPANNPELAIGSTDSAKMITRLLDAWTKDMSFALDRLQQLNQADPTGRLTRHLDLDHVGAYGHSFGGAVVAQFCHDDPRCKSGLDIDGAPLGNVIQSGINRPFLFLLSDHSHDVGPEVDRIKADIQSIYDHLPANARYRVEIRGANHFTFSDDGALLKSRVFRGVLRVFGKLSIDGRQQLGATAFCVHTFFDRYLKADGQEPVCTSNAFPEIQTPK